jgi:hypothetical protein
MKIFAAISLLFALTSYAEDFKSSMTIPTSELMSYKIVAQYPPDMLTVAARMIQLQLSEGKSVDCNAGVNQKKFGPDGSKEYTFDINSKNCKVMLKSDGSCPSGFDARNIPEYISSPDLYEYKVGADKYKLCIKSNSNDSGSTGSGRVK